jgi:hypothetical protein
MAMFQIEKNVPMEVRNGGRDESKQGVTVAA